MIPLGGYVKMLDEREDEVAPEERHLAFNNQSLPVRSAVVFAGPAFNFIFAFFRDLAGVFGGQPGFQTRGWQCFGGLHG